ncbi:hypothetical protein INQ41_00670 [Lysobacter ciconiae]|uniref:Uncharacterized protein n=1 Tax=Novilysobacter ciconiae TaxID=2781022 RepID=A0A7S6UG34_9GAMM|nr:hypothetical protein [Lysobacter ciconiae]QOW19642.1 hypothetical protein INQ41_00670 [Lysobacter ciconiae]
MKKTLWIVLVVTLAACAGYFAWNSYLSPKARAIALVKQSLNDPDSAVFEQVHYVTRTGATCGSVNAKNRMGGYAGQTAFVVGKNGSVTFAPTGNTESGSTETRIEALQEQLDFLEKTRICVAEGSED